LGFGGDNKLLISIDQREGIAQLWDIESKNEVARFSDLDRIESPQFRRTAALQRLWRMTRPYDFNYGARGARQACVRTDQPSSHRR
jgi:hypothetical protein